METAPADIAVHISEFKKNPCAVPRKANKRHVAVRYRNRTAF